MLFRILIRTWQEQDRVLTLSTISIAIAIMTFMVLVLLDIGMLDGVRNIILGLMDVKLQGDSMQQELMVFQVME